MQHDCTIEGQDAKFSFAGLKLLFLEHAPPLFHGTRSCFIFEFDNLSDPRLDVTGFGVVGVPVTQESASGLATFRGHGQGSKSRDMSQALELTMADVTIQDPAWGDQVRDAVSDALLDMNFGRPEVRSIHLAQVISATARQPASLAS